MAINRGFIKCWAPKKYASSEDDFACLVDYLEESFKEVQFKMFYPLVETSCPKLLKMLMNSVTINHYHIADAL